MAEKIEATVQPTTLVVTSGDTVEAIASLRNLGQTVDQLTLSIDGLDTSWYTLPVSSVALFPNDQDNLRIVFHPPKNEAGSYPFRINVTSQESPEEKATTELSIEVRALPGLELSISPERIAGRKGSYHITVNNTGDIEAKLRLEASGAQGTLKYSLQPESLTVPGGGQADATLEVKLSWLAFLGGEKEFPIKVRAIPAGADQFTQEIKTISAQFVRIPWYKALPEIKIPWLARAPIIDSFRTSTEDKREFSLTWAVRRATEVELDGDAVEPRGGMLLRPMETTTYTLTARNKYGSADQSVTIQPPPVPTAKASERVRVSLTPGQLQAQAGMAPVPATLEVQNLGDIVDKFIVEVEGLDESWYSRSASSLALFPQATDHVQILFQPPNKKGVRSGEHPFAITVRSQTNPEDATSVVGQLAILPSVDFKLSVRPVRVSCRRKGSYRVHMANTGISDIRFTLEATDLDEGCDFRFKHDNQTLVAWKTVEVPMIAKPKRGSFIGEKKRYDVSVTAIVGDGNTQSANCELYHNPFVGSWRPIIRIVRAVLVLGVIGVGAFYLIQLGGGWGHLTTSPQGWVNQLVHAVENWFFR